MTADRGATAGTSPQERLTVVPLALEGARETASETARASAREDRTMKRSWLVQRLERPWEAHAIFGADNPFAFGGGLRNGGLSDDAMGLLRGVFSFAYMGAAEFEWGAVPKALQAIAKDTKHHCAWSFDLPLAEVPPHWRDRKAAPPKGNATIYVISRVEDVDEVERRIWQWATEPFNDLKESTQLSSVLREPADYDFPTRIGGWLELDNGFFFFTDETMWRGTAALFGLNTPAVA